MLLVQWRSHNRAFAERTNDTAGQHVGIAEWIVVADGVNRFAFTVAENRYLLTFNQCTDAGIRGDVSQWIT